MKAASAELIAYLNSTTEFFRCDLYEITLNGGTMLRYTDYDMPITLPDGRKFLASGPTFERGRTQLSSTISVDAMNVTMFVDGDDRIDGVPMMTVARNGGFDEAKCTVYICFMSFPGVIVDVLEWFTGTLDVQDGGGLELTLQNKSLIQKANVDYPARLYFPTCPYSVYSAGCGLNVVDFTKTGKITRVISKQRIYTDLNFADGYYDLGGIEFTSGDLVGTSMSIKNSYQSNGQIVMLAALDALPAVGDTFKIYPGCAKTPEMCKNKFGNLKRNRATPYIPLKETIL